MSKLEPQASGASVVSKLTINPKSKSRGPCRWWRKQSSSLGIDFGQINTKIVIAERSSTQDVVYQAVTIPTSTSTLVEDHNTGVPPEGTPLGERRVRNSTGVASIAPTTNWSKRALRELASRINQVVGTRENIHAMDVSVMMSMSTCDYRTIYVPKNARVNTAGLQQTISAAIEDKRARCIAVVPGYDHQSKENQADEKQTKVRCFSLPEDLAWTVAQQLDEVGLSPSTMNGLPWCIANALEMVIPVEEKSLVHVGLDWSYGEPTLVSLVNGQIDYIRCLSNGSLRELTSRAADDFGMSPTEAGRWLAHCMQSTNVVVDSAVIETRDWVCEVCMRLAKEISTALEFIRWRNQGVKLQTIWVMGGAAHIEGLVEHLASQVSSAVKPWCLSSESSSLSSEYALAASLAWLGQHHA